ncbi:MAG TPA: tetratricopeptide repeat protein, partial [Longimicrobiales bacterium]|nr:tetratricopeptide repeat protein [Longimicrobiales bacterium]
EGMVDVLAGNLDGAGGLRSIDPRTVMSHWRRAVGEGDDPELGAILEIARSAGARYAVVGSAVRIGDEVRLSTQIYDVVGGGDVGSAQVAGPNGDVLSLVDRLSVQTAAEVLASGGGTLDRLRHTTSLTTNSPDALRAYLEGEALYRGADFAGASDAFRRAVAMDSTFALAAVRLSRSLGWLRNIGDQESGEALALAQRFRDRLPPREREHLELEALIEAGSQRSVGAAREGTQSYPDDPEFWEAYGEALYHQGAEAGYSLADTRGAFARALELDPDFGPLYIHPMELAVSSGDVSRAFELLEAWRPLAEPDEFRMRSAFMALQIGDQAAQTEAMAYLPEIPDREFTTGYVYAYARTADHAAADRAIADEYRRRGFGGTADMVLFSERLSVGAVDEALDLAFKPVSIAEGRSATLLSSAVIPGAAAARPSRYALPDPGECRGFDCWALGAVAVAWDDEARSEAYIRRYEGIIDSLATSEPSEEYIEGERAYLDILRAYAAWHAGDLDDGEALARFRAVHAQRAPASGYFILRHSSIRWWIAEALLRQNRYDEARRYFDSLWDAPWGAYFTMRDVGLGDAYRGMGDEAAAREAYERFLGNWSEAPVDNPLVVRAKAGLESLGS